MADQHSAAGPALGYQYQADYCLLALLRDAGPGRAISLELHDDVAWDQEGTAVEKLQLKHTINATGGLGDSSDAMWRTVQAWMDAGHATGQGEHALVLVTTGKATAGTAAHALRPDTRDAAAASAALRAAASTSTNKDTLKARERFLRLSVPAQNAFVASISVVDAQPMVIDIDQAIRDREYLRMPDSAAKQDEFMARLWGWWRGRVVEMLARRYFPDRDLRESVAAAELKAELLRLTVSFSEHGLPEYEDLDIDDDIVLVGLEEEAFVAQLKLVKVHKAVIRRALIDFYRATSSETRWLERDFLRTDEVIRYERKLREAWDLEFGLMLSQLSATPTDEQEAQAGLQLLHTVLSKPPLRIRNKVDQDFYYRGKHHMLAQDVQVGWHPQFEQRVAEMLVGHGVTA